MVEQRWEILRYYFENHANVAECVQKLRTDFERREAPSAPYVRYLVKKVKETGILIDNVKSLKQCVLPRILLLWQKVCVKHININSPLISIIGHFANIIETNFT